MAPDFETVQAMSNLFGQVDFRRFRAFLEAIEKEETKRAVYADGFNSDVARGRAQMVSWLREQIETSQDRASKMEIRSDKPPTPRR